MTDHLALDLPQAVNGSSALISKDGLYRYRLDRVWGLGWRTIVWIMLNPSTADAEIEDATSRRVQAFTRAWGYDGLTIVNLYGYRATKPTDLWRAADPVGQENDRHILEAVNEAATVVAAWGANAKPGRIAQVLDLVGPGRLHALAVTDAGQPRHPLYLRSDLTPQPWKVPDA